jgi:K(+)-stimulated pyrophosphate-energized sodium pump
VGDPFKDTTSVALNPIIKFSTLFGLLAVEISVGMKQAATVNGTTDISAIIGIVMLLISLFFIWRSFYAMRIPRDPELANAASHSTVPTAAIRTSHH